MVVTQNSSAMPKKTAVAAQPPPSENKKKRKVAAEPAEEPPPPPAEEEPPPAPAASVVEPATKAKRRQPLNGYMLFYKEECGKYGEPKPRVPQMGKEIGAKWHALPEAERDRYRELAKAQQPPPLVEVAA